MSLFFTITLALSLTLSTPPPDTFSSTGVTITYGEDTLSRDTLRSTTLLFYPESNLLVIRDLEIGREDYYFLTPYIETSEISGRKLCIYDYKVGIDKFYIDWECGKIISVSRFQLMESTFIEGTFFVEERGYSTTWDSNR